MNVMVGAAVLVFVWGMFGTVTHSAASTDDVTVGISDLAHPAMPGCEETDQCFEPSTVTIDVGSEVVWHNDGMTAHAIISGTLRDSGSDGIFESGLLYAGETFSHMFTKAGDYPYFCIIHPWMTGSVVVQETSVVQVIDSYNPTTITIETGEEVVWHNEDTLLHTVTSGSPDDGGQDGIFNSGPLASGMKFTHTFTEDGVYPYFCVLHPWLSGKVVVQDAAIDNVMAQVVLDMPAPQISEGDSILISGRLTVDNDHNSTIADQTILIKDGSANATLIALVTNDDGSFEWVLTGISYGAYEIYASYEGKSHGPTESAKYGIQVDSRDVPDEPSSSLITLDHISETIHAGETVTFTGRLTDGGSAIPHRVVWIHEDDISRVIGYGITNMQGDFAVQWTSTIPLEADLEVYAIFHGDSWYAKSQSANQATVVIDETT